MHVWRVEAPHADATLLSPAERARAGSYASGSRARAFVATRTALRRILGAYLDTAPAAVPLEAERHHKPHVDALDPLRRVSFNLAHRLDRMLIAVAREVEVGVDVELGRSPHEVRAVERTVLSEAERASVEALGAEERHAAVVRQWVRREAVIKATGEGLRIPPATIDVGAPEVRSARRLVDAGGASWRLWDLTPWQDATGAVAAEPTVTSVRCLEWTAAPTG
ncbi:MAG TPA: 4'-phosphopantetheinyl transferase superfamily protein [Acidimicrobiia bacterium]|nr:4'-phosphopantetheinyl transferase superfamily protein [Acidimicrobiia bacterium]